MCMENAQKFMCGMELAPPSCYRNRLLGPRWSNLTTPNRPAAMSAAVDTQGEGKDSQSSIHDCLVLSGQINGMMGCWSLTESSM